MTVGDPPHPEPSLAPDDFLLPPRPTDRELLDAHLRGDPGAFATLVGRHQDRLSAIALRVMRDPDATALERVMVTWG